MIRRSSSFLLATVLFAALGVLPRGASAQVTLLVDNAFGCRVDDEPVGRIVVESGMNLDPVNPAVDVPDE